MTECDWQSKKGTYTQDSRFISELKKDQQKIASGEDVMTVNGSPMGGAVWNLIISRRDLTLWTATFQDGRPMKMKPHRHWKVTDVKNYFGIKGTGVQLMANFMALYVDVMGDENEQ